METKLTYHIYRPDAEVEHGEVKWSGRFGEVKRLIEDTVGGRLEHVTVLFNGVRSDMFVHDHSAINGSVPNMAATQIYRAATMERVPGTPPESLPGIFGVAIVFDQIIWT